MKADPIEQYLQANVPIRVLLEHGAQRLDWLAYLEASPIVISYRDTVGKIVNEEVTKVGLIERAHSLGWEPAEQGEIGALAFSSVSIWEDNANEPEATHGIWFAHEDAMHWEVNAWGTPLGIPAARFSALEERERAAGEESQRRLAELELRDQVRSVAQLCDSHIRSRAKGRMKHDGVKLGYSQAWEEVQAIANLYGFDVYTDYKFAPHPWSVEQARQANLLVQFWSDIESGRPLDRCVPHLPLAPTDAHVEPTA